jgi:hypothetical protein
MTGVIQNPAYAKIKGCRKATFFLHLDQRDKQTVELRLIELTFFKFDKPLLE